MDQFFRIQAKPKDQVPHHLCFLSPRFLECQLSYGFDYFSNPININKNIPSTLYKHRKRISVLIARLRGQLVLGQGPFLAIRLVEINPRLEERGKKYHVVTIRTVY